MVIVMEMLRGTKPVAQICRENGIKDNLAYRWRDEALAGMQNAFSDKRKEGRHSAESENDRLLKIIGQQALVIDFQKKISQRLSL